VNKRLETSSQIKKQPSDQQPKDAGGHRAVLTGQDLAKGEAAQNSNVFFIFAAVEDKVQNSALGNYVDVVARLVLPNYNLRCL
jgi:hypothetical protein